MSAPHKSVHGISKLQFGVNPYDRCPTEVGRYHVIDSQGFIRAKMRLGCIAFDHAGNLSDREQGEFKVVDTADGSEYGAYLTGECIR